MRYINRLFTFLLTYFLTFVTKVLDLPLYEFYDLNDDDDDDDDRCSTCFSGWRPRLRPLTCLQFQVRRYSQYKRPSTHENSQ